MTAKRKTTKRRPYVLVRCTAAGVHAGELVSRKGTEVTLANSRRTWYWSGAASLSELARYGAKNVSACKFAVARATITVLDACEIIPCSAAGAKPEPWRDGR